MGRREALDKLGQGTYGTEGEKLRWSYYDRMLVSATVLTQRLFTIPLGQAGKTLADTNLTVAGQIPQGQQLHVNEIFVMYKSAATKATTNVQMIYDMFEQSTLSIKLQNKDAMLQVTLQEVLGASSLIALTPTAAGDNIPLIQPKYHGIYPISPMIVLAALTPFEITIQHHTAPNAALANDVLKVALRGTLFRAS